MLRYRRTSGPPCPGPCACDHPRQTCPLLSSWVGCWVALLYPRGARYIHGRSQAAHNITAPYACACMHACSAATLQRSCTHSSTTGLMSAHVHTPPIALSCSWRTHACASRPHLECLTHGCAGSVLDVCHVLALPACNHSLSYLSQPVLQQGWSVQGLLGWQWRQLGPRRQPYGLQVGTSIGCGVELSDALVGIGVGAHWLRYGLTECRHAMDTPCGGGGGGVGGG